MEIHALKLHLIILGSVLYLQNMEAMPLPFSSYLLPFTRKVLEAEAIACHSLAHHNKSLLQ